MSKKHEENLKGLADAVAALTEQLQSTSTKQATASRAKRLFGAGGAGVGSVLLAAFTAAATAVVVPYAVARTQAVIPPDIEPTAVNVTAEGPPRVNQPLDVVIRFENRSTTPANCCTAVWFTASGVVNRVDAVQFSSQFVVPASDSSDATFQKHGRLQKAGHFFVTVRVECDNFGPTFFDNLAIDVAGEQATE